jgi:hypothetical protein
LREQNIINDFTTVEGLTNISSITNMLPIRSDMSLNQYCIKGSFNSAFDGKKISENNIKNVLLDGCRFIDLQVYYSETDNIVYVANIPDPNGKIIESQNNVPLDNIFNAIATNAFSNIQSSNGCPNPKDPLFVHLRIIPHDKIYDMIAVSIKSRFPNNIRYIKDNNANIVNGNTRLNEIGAKTIFLIDKQINPDWTNKSKKLQSYINAETGGDTFTIYDYTQMINKMKTIPVVHDNYRTTNINKESIVIPNTTYDEKQPSIVDMVLNYGCQIVLYPFYQRSDNLIEYEKLFNEYKTAFLPMAYAIKYLETRKHELQNSNPSFGGII